MSYERQRFSVGHELGHWHYHRGKTSFCRPDDIENYSRKALDPERVADNYAADLLMPRYLFESEANKFSNMTLDSAKTLAKSFKTSLTATAIRFVDMGPAPAMVICHGTEGRKWFHRGRDVPENFFPCRELDHDSFAFEVLFGNKQDSGIHKIPADAWIDRWNADRFEVVEQTVKTARNDVLTMIWWQDESQIEDAIR